MCDTVAQSGRPVRVVLTGCDTTCMAAMAVTEVPIDAADAILAGRLPWNHREPFDRMIVAQAARRGRTIATRDADILGAALSPP